MIIQKQKFRRKDFKKSADCITIWLNEDERSLLDNAKKILMQPKDSTALKQLAIIGSKTIGDDKIDQFRGFLLNNVRKNKRLGIDEIE